MNIVMVKKILADGSPCKKCGEVLAKMEADDQLKFMDEILIADERDAESDGMKLAKKLGVDRAPFFVASSHHQRPSRSCWLGKIARVQGSQPILVKPFSCIAL